MSWLGFLAVLVVAPRGATGGLSARVLAALAGKLPLPPAAGA